MNLIYNFVNIFNFFSNQNPNQNNQSNTSKKTMIIYHSPREFHKEIMLRKSEYFFEHIKEMKDKIKKDSVLINEIEDLNNHEYIIRCYTSDIFPYFNKPLLKETFNYVYPNYGPFSKEEIESMIWCLHSSLRNYDKYENKYLKKINDETIVYHWNKKILDNISIGSKFFIPQFFSTCIYCRKDDSGIFGKNLYIITIKNNEKNNYCYNITNLSYHKEEYEILITAFSTFVLKSIKDNKDGSFTYELDCLGYEFDSYIEEIENKIKKEIFEIAKISIDKIDKIDWSAYEDQGRENIIKEIINVINKTNDKYIEIKNKGYKLINQVDKEIYDYTKHQIDNYFARRFIEEIQKKTENRVVIRTSLANKNLDVQYCKFENESPIILYDAHGGKSQVFKLINNYDGTVTFEIEEKFAIDVRYSKMEEGNIIQIYEKNGTRAQKFYLEDRGDDYVSIHSSIDQNYVIDVSNSRTNNFNKIHLWKYNGTNAQKFRIIYI